MIMEYLAHDPSVQAVFFIMLGIFVSIVTIRNSILREREQKHKFQQEDLAEARQNEREKRMQIESKPIPPKKEEYYVGE